jgi:hypothetical protein
LTSSSLAVVVEVHVSALSNLSVLVVKVDDGVVRLVRLLEGGDTSAKTVCRVRTGKTNLEETLVAKTRALGDSLLLGDGSVGDGRQLELRM